MQAKEDDKARAISLRKEGRTYSEILIQIPVAKSTLSLWLRDVGLSKRQQQCLTKARLVASKRGGESRRLQRIEKTNRILTDAKKDIRRISQRELFLIGAVLYWAEGTKEKEYRPGARVEFSNSDPSMLRVFKTWLIESAKLTEADIRYEIYLHETSKGRLQEIKRYWSRELRIPLASLGTVYLKRGLLKTNRKNTKNGYYGLVKLRVRSSSSLARSLRGWAEGISESLGDRLKVGQRTLNP